MTMKMMMMMSGINRLSIEYRDVLCWINASCGNNASLSYNELKKLMLKVKSKV